MQSILPATLLTKAGPKPTAEVLAGKKAVGLYFSAHWCPPCRGFTPILAQFYSALKKADANALEIIFVTSDENDESFMGYYGEHPWTAVAYGDETIERLGETCGVRGIPSFQIFNPATGNIVEADGRSAVMNGKGDPAGTAAKWAK